MPFWAITSDLELLEAAPPAEAFALEDVPGVGALIRPAEGEKCQRCWKILPEVGQQSDPHLCGRCAEAVSS